MPKKSVGPSRYVKIPGTVFKWIEKYGGKEMKNIIKQCRQTPNLWNKSWLIVVLTYVVIWYPLSSQFFYVGTRYYDIIANNNCNIGDCMLVWLPNGMW